MTVLREYIWCRLLLAVNVTGLRWFDYGVFRLYWLERISACYFLWNNFQVFFPAVRPRRRVGAEMEEGWLPSIKPAGSHPHPQQGSDTGQSTPHRVVLISSSYFILSYKNRSSLLKLCAAAASFSPYSLLFNNNNNSNWCFKKKSSHLIGRAF